MGILGRLNPAGEVAEYPTHFGRGGVFHPTDYGNARRVIVGESDFYVVHPNEASLSGQELSAVLDAERPMGAAQNDHVRAVDPPNEGGDIFAASFEVGVENADPLTAVFVDTTVGPAKSWLWDFGDGKTSKKQNPTHKYEQAGTYTVLLTATSATGLTSQYSVDNLTLTAPPEV